MESKLHGCLDGAMKFVKGDAIAGIVIIVINLLGGLAIGVMMQDMDVGTAMTKYSILTIGEGMVAQIPALLGAMAAGLIVTRTSDEDDKHLGDSIRKQITAKPRVLLVGRRHLPADGAGARLPGRRSSSCWPWCCGGAGALLTPACASSCANVRHPDRARLVKRLDDAAAGDRHRAAGAAPGRAAAAARARRAAGRRPGAPR